MANSTSEDRPGLYDNSQNLSGTAPRKGEW